MASTGAQRTHVRLAAALLASLLVGCVLLTYLSYTSAFSPIDTVTLTAPRAGLEMDRGNKVKYRGVQVGKVDDVSYEGEQAHLKLAIDDGELRYIPSNAAVHIASSTVFGAKSVEFIPPKAPSPAALRPGAHLAVSAVSLEVNTLFQSLMGLLQKIDPVELNGTLGALAEGLRGHGRDLGGVLSGLNTLTQPAESEAADSSTRLPQGGCRRQHLRGRGTRPGHRLRQHAHDRQDSGRSADQPEHHPVGCDRLVQQRL